jgi:hypothetical protein
MKMAEGWSSISNCVFLRLCVGGLDTDMPDSVKWVKAMPQSTPLDGEICESPSCTPENRQWKSNYDTEVFKSRSRKEKGRPLPCSQTVQSLRGNEGCKRVPRSLCHHCKVTRSYCQHTSSICMPAGDSNTTCTALFFRKVAHETN